MRGIGGGLLSGAWIILDAPDDITDASNRQSAGGGSMPPPEVAASASCRAPVWKFRAGVFSFLRAALTEAQSSMSTPPNKYTYPISNIRVIDGDTIEADVDLGFRIRQRQVIRLAGIDAPELRAKDAVEREKAKAAKTGLEYVLIACQPTEVLMHSTGLDKYGRSLADVWAYYEDGAFYGPRWGNTNRWMIENNHATKQNHE